MPNKAWLDGKVVRFLKLINVIDATDDEESTQEIEEEFYHHDDNVKGGKGKDPHWL